MTVLCALDLTRYSPALVRQAKHWASSLGTGVELFHVEPPTVGFGAVPTDLVSALHQYEAHVRSAVAAREQELEALAARVRAQGVDCTTRQLTGRPGPAILERARELEAPLLVLGPHSSILPRQWLEQAQVGSRFLGGVTAHVLRRAACPVLVTCGVELGHRLPAPAGRWVVGVDDSPSADAALAWAGRLVDRASAEMRIAHVVERLGAGGTGTEDLWAHLKEHAQHLLDQRLAARLRTLVAVGEPGPMLLETAATENAALIILGRGGRPKARFGTSLRHVLRHAKIPVLVVPTVED